MDKIKIFDVPWHLGHQYEQLKFPWAQFDWMFNHRRSYSEKPRGDMQYQDGFDMELMPQWMKDRVNGMRKMPFGQGFNWVIDYEPGKYDVAILHLDQQCVEPGILDKGKGSVYRHLNEVIKDIPKIVIMHGTPYYPEVFPNSQDMIDQVKELVGDNYFVVNSHRAVQQWGWGKAIIHGMDPAEWWDLPKEPRIVTMISPGGLPAYYDRSFLDYVREGLAGRDIHHCHITVDWQAESWDEYREFLGRSLIYFNPTRESPMPRSRTEAMLSGCCVITTPNQDADTFIEHGKNGFLVKRNPEEVVNLIEKLLDDPAKAIAIGKNGKETAKEIFNWDRYNGEWQEYVDFVIKDWKEKHGR